MIKNVKQKGFTLIELIVVMTIIAILVLLASPKYLSYTKDAHLTRIKVNIKELEQASQKYYMVHNAWPRLTDAAYTPEELKEYSERVLDKTGSEILLEEGNYYDIDYSKLTNYLKTPEDKENYILRNPVGSIYYLENLTELGKESLGGVGKVETPGPQPNEPVEGATDGVYTFHGEVKAENFITGNQLASQIGLTAGSSQYSDEPWLKFTRQESDGNITTMLVAKKPLRYNLSWGQINAVGAVFGTKTVEIDGQTYKVRLMSHNVEWDRIMLQTHEQSLDESWAFPYYVGSDITSFIHRLGTGNQNMYNDMDLLTHRDYGNGSVSWLQADDTTDYRYKHTRGYLGGSNHLYQGYDRKDLYHGWRPVLELEND